MELGTIEREQSRNHYFKHKFQNQFRDNREDDEEKKSKEKLLNPIDLNIVTLCNAKSLKHNKWKTQEQRSN
jgi:hypothetical protein